MASFAATGHLTTPNSSRSRSKFSTPTTSRTPPTASTTHKIVCHASPPSSSSSSFQNPKPLKPKSNTPVIPLNKTLLLTAASTTALFGLSLIGNGGGTGGGFGGGGGGGGGGGDGRGPGNFWSRLFSRDAMAKDEENSEAGAEGWTPHGLPAGAAVELKKLDALKKYKVSEILFFDRRRWATVGNDSFFEMISMKPGGSYNKSDLEKELETLTTCGMFEKVELEVKPKPDGTLGVTVSFAESTWQAADRFACKSVGLMPPSKQVKVEHEMTEREQYEFLRNLELDYKRRMDRARPCLLPVSVHEEILGMMKGQAKVSARLLQKIRDRVQKWYHDNGYLTAQVVNFGNLNTREVVCEVAEGDITQLVVQFLDKMGNECEGHTQLGVVTREIPEELKPGNVFNVEAGKQALRSINSLALFSNIEVNPRPDEKKEGGIVVEIKLKEVEQKSAEVSTEWSIVPAGGGQATGGALRPTLASILPGGSVSFEHRNIKGLNRSLLGTVTTSNFLNPQDDLSFKLEYVHPYVDGIRDPRNRTFRTSCFNIRKSSPVFTGGPEVEVPPIWVDRSGVKANITENFTRQSKFTYGLVMEEITTRDENSQISPNGHRVLPSGGIIADGPPTTLSGTGIDRLAFAQANITRDNTKFVNGAIVGVRNVFQVDQGLGIGSKFPFFNRHQLTLTRFIPLKQVEVGAGKSPPPVLVLHGHYGGCVGDLPGYDAFTLGGPYSVRGYNMGEIGSARNILEVAAELRVPVRNTQVYAFAEHGNDLGSSKDVKGNPTQVYRRRGHGSSYGAGVKLGLVRVEYAVDHNNGTGAMFVRFGERF